MLPGAVLVIYCALARDFAIWRRLHLGKGLLLFFVMAESWFVLVAPAGTPQPIIDKLSAEVDRILKKPEVAERFAKIGATPVGGTPKQLGDFIAAETVKWKEVVRVSGAKVD